ncbi:MAG TPA: 50S ribosomal protein L11 methyltransferase [Steroidobacteraceae bacterium]|jgi:ribosomal protein L11 methyltransferase
MPFLQLTLTIGTADPAPFEDALLAAGAVSITLQDAADDPVLEPAPGTTPLWPSVRVSALFDASADPAAVTQILSSQLPSPLPAVDFQQLADRVWEREWLKDFHPMRFGGRLWICPDGQRPDPDLLRTADGEPSMAACYIDLDPGLAFGTGTHPTTALCLEWLDGAQLHGKTIIDYGCGSGVLAIAALKLGAASAIAVDIDEQAVTATLDNARRNGVAERLSVSTVAQMNAQPADILLANILAEPLEQLAPTLSGLVVAGGHIVLSGLLHDQSQRVAGRYVPWFAMEPAALREGWARLHGVRRFA